MWYAEGDRIHILNEDGTKEVLSTNWEEMREALRIAERLKALEIRLAVQQNQQEKRDTASIKKGGRGC